MEWKMKKLNIISAVMAAAAAAAGIFSGVYDEIPWVIWQMKGQDWVSIAAAAAMIIISMSDKDKYRAAGAGINAYFIYTFFFYALELNLNPLFHLYLAIVLLSLISIIRTISDLKKRSNQTASKGAAVTASVYLLMIALMLSILWNADIIASIAGEPILETASGKPLTIVYVFDIGFVIPAIVYTLYSVLKKTSFSPSLCIILLVKCTTMGAALLGMTVGLYFGGLEFQSFLAVLWTALTAAGLISLAVFLKGSRIGE